MYIKRIQVSPASSSLIPSDSTYLSSTSPSLLIRFSNLTKLNTFYRLLASVIETRADLAVELTFFDGIALFVHLFATSEREAKFDKTARSIERNWHNCQSFFFVFVAQSVQFAFVDQDLAVVAGIGGVIDASWRVGADVRVF